MDFENKLQQLMENMNFEQEDNAILNTTGALVEEKAPERLFYYNFSEDEVKDFFDVFEKFKNYFSTREDKRCADMLYEELHPLMKKMDGRSIEPMLYASRIIKGIIDSNKNVTDALVELVAKFLDNNEVVRYISSGWEWSAQLKILIEACGDINYGEYIETVMANYTRIVSLFSENQSEIIRSYLNMVLSSQDDKSVEYLIKIMRSSALMNNSSNYKLLKNPIFNSDFMNIEDNYEKVMNGVTENGIPSGFKYELKKYERKNKNNTFSGYVFGKQTHATLRYFIGIKDPESLKIGIDKFISHIDEIPQDGIKSQVYYTLGQKASITKDIEYKNKVKEFLNAELDKDSNFFVGIKLGLLFLEINYSKPEEIKNYMYPIFDRIIESDNQNDQKTIAQFFRFRTDIFSIFLDFLNDCMSKSNEKNDISKYLGLLSEMCEAYSNNFSKETYSAPKVIDILKYTASNMNRSIIRNCLDIIDILIENSTTTKKSISSVLKYIKEQLSGKTDYITWIRYIDKRIQEVDPIVAPE